MNPVAGWDFTLSAAENSKEAITAFLEGYAKKWAFQKEKGAENGFEHYQGRMSLIKKKREGELYKAMREANLVFSGAAVRPTCGATFNDENLKYVLKQDTRIEGPWTSEDAEEDNYIPSDLRLTPTWNAMQERVIGWISKPPNRRTIHCVVDPVGNNGKSFMAMWAWAHKKAVYIPFFTEAKDLMRMVHGLPKYGCYFIDLPRALSHKAMHEIYGGIEQLKTGMIYEDRYRFRMEMIEPCHVVVFTNRMPDFNLASADRWHVWVLPGEAAQQGLPAIE